jgi:CheY-like chemotaxis protein
LAGAEPLAPVEGGSETILVVEDDAEVRAGAVDVLAHLGYRVLQAADADQALEILRSYSKLPSVGANVCSFLSPFPRIVTAKFLRIVPPDILEPFSADQNLTAASFQVRGVVPCSKQLCGNEMIFLNGRSRLMMPSADLPER